MAKRCPTALRQFADQRSWALILTPVAFFMTALESLVVVTTLEAIHAGLGGSVATLE